MSFELPLFPLNNVLFPGMPLPLHIFEERYKQMVQLCLRTQGPFGVVLIREGEEALGPLAVPHEVGCTAQIVNRQLLPGGRMNILAIGKERFRVLTTTRERPYLVGIVERAPLEVHDPAAVDRSGRQLRPLVEKYLTLLEEAGGDEFDISQLPRDTVSLAYFGAMLLQVAADKKQALLGSEYAMELLTETQRLFRAEIPLLRLILEGGGKDLEGPGSFSLN